MFYQKGYIKEPIDLKQLDGCSFRFNSNEVSCVKHGCIDYLQIYNVYKKKFRTQNIENIIFSLIGLGLLFYAIFIDKK